MFHLKPSICCPLVICRPGRSRHSPPQLWYWRRLFSKTSRPALGPTRPPTQGLPWAFSPGELKLPRREADHWLPSSTEFNHSYPVPSLQNEWSHTSTIPIYLHGVYKDTLRLQHNLYLQCNSSRWAPPFHHVLLLLVFVFGQKQGSCLLQIIGSYSMMCSWISSVPSGNYTDVTLT